MNNKTYEYMVGGMIAKNLTAGEQQNKLNSLGAEGWELVSSIKQMEGNAEYLMFYFKRETPNFWNSGCLTL